MSISSGVSAAVRSVIWGVGRGLGAVATASAKVLTGLWMVTRVSARSFGEAVFAAYEWTGGNEAFNIRPSSKARDRIEVALHVFTGAYAIGFLFSYVLINLRWMTHLPYQMGRFAWKNEADFQGVNWGGIAKYVLGFPGIAVGAALSSLVLVTRAVFSTIETMLRVSWQIASRALPETLQVALPDDDRLPRWKRAGALGAIPGFMFGVLGYLTLGGTRLVLRAVHSYRRAIQLAYFVAGTDSRRSDAWRSDQALLSPVEKGVHFLSGAYVLGFLGAMFVTSAQWIVYLPSQVKRWLLGEVVDAKMHGKAKYVVGLPGILIGSFLSVPVFVVFGFYSTCKTALHVSAKFVNQALPIDKAIILQDTRNTPLKRLGVLGYIPGACLGVMAFVIVGGARITAETAYLIWQKAATYIRRVKTILVDVLSSYQDGIKLAYQKTGGQDCFPLGQPAEPRLSLVAKGLHFISGAYVLGMLGSIAVINLRWMIRLPTQMMRFVSDEGFPIKRTEWRPGLAKFILGLPGIVVGIVLGIPLSLIQLYLRWSDNTRITAALVARRMTKWFLSEENPIDDNRSLANKRFGYLVGYPWGALMGGVAIGVVILWRTVKHTGLTFFEGVSRALSVVLDVDWSLKTDRSNKERYGYGLAGAVLAIPVALSLGAIWILFHVALMGMSVASSVLVAGVRAVDESYKFAKHGLRFSRPWELSSESTIRNKHYERFKALFAGLTVGGELPELAIPFVAADNIRHDAGFFANWNGHTAAKFFRKSLSFNRRTLTEMILNTIEKAFRESPEASMNVEVTINGIVRVEQQEIDDNWFSSRKTREREKAIVYGVGEYVKAYLAAEANTAPPVAPEAVRLGYQTDTMPGRVYATLFPPVSANGDDIEPAMGRVVSR